MKYILTVLLTLISFAVFSQNQTIGNKNNTVEVLGKLLVDSGAKLIKQPSHSDSSTNIVTSEWVKRLLPKCFDPVDYGADPTGVSNSTTAFAACMAAVVAAKGGRICIHQNNFLVDSINIPAIPAAEDIVITIEGDIMPNFLIGTVDYPYVFPTKGPIIRSTSTSPTASVIKALPLAGTFSFANVYLKNLDIRTYDNPRIGGIDLTYAPFATLENVFINTNIYGIRSAEPTHNTIGLRMPTSNNGARSILENVTITGYATQLVASEHVNANNLHLGNGITGILMESFGPHGANFDRIEMMGLRYLFETHSDCEFIIQHLDVEHLDSATQYALGKAYQITWADFNDPANNMRARVNYKIVGASGSPNDLLKTGANLVIAQKIGENAPSLQLGRNIQSNTKAALSIEKPNSDGLATSYPGIAIQNTDPTSGSNYTPITLLGGNTNIVGEINTSWGAGAIPPYSFGTGMYMSTFTNHPLIFSTNGTQRAMISNSGNFGIGTTSPSKVLHTVGTVRHASLGTTSFDTTTYKPMGINSSGDLIPIGYWPGSGGGGGGISGSIAANQVAVGSGTDAISGSSNFTHRTQGSYYIPVIGSSSYGALDFKDNSNNLIGEFYTTGTGFQFYTATGIDLSFYTNNSLATALLYLGTNQSVGINKGSASATLDVNGTMVTNGGVQLIALTGGGAVIADAVGNLSVASDERLKFIQKSYRTGLKEIREVNPVLFKYRPESGMDTIHIYAGFTAQNIEKALGEYAIGKNPTTGMMSIQDRAILAVAINAIKELDKKNKAQDKKINYLIHKLKNK